MSGIRHKPSGGIAHFGRSSAYAFGLIFREKEILVFAILQWVTIGLTYLLWVQMLDWIPEEVWEAASESDSLSAADVILTIWSFLCIGIAAYPIGILTGCMGAAHFLKRYQGHSTIASCFALVLPQNWPLWTFHWIDGWITCRQILNRLPRTNDNRSAAQKARSEALYYAWKVGVAGILPSILTGNNLIQSGKNSIFFVRHNFVNVVSLRAGYSALCWIVGILGYIGGVVFLLTFIDTDGAKSSSLIYDFYLWACVPLMIALLFVMLILRPIYVIALCDLYSRHLEENGKWTTLTRLPSKGVSALVAFACLAVFIGAVFIFRQELGIIDALANSYQ